MTNKYDNLPEYIYDGVALTIMDDMNDDPANPYTIIEANQWPEDEPIFISSIFGIGPILLTEKTGQEILETLKRIEDKLDK